MNSKSKKLKDETLYFKSADPIILDYTKAVSYFECRAYDHSVMNAGYVWHQIFIKHKGKVSFNDGKKLILDAIFDIVGKEEFYPVRYTYTEKEDWFLVRNCTKALDRLFSTNLRIRLANGIRLSLWVVLNVAKYKFGQIAPKTKISEAVIRLCSNLISFKTETGLLNLSNFEGCQEFEDIEISLGNHVILEYVCNMIYKNDDNYRHIKGIILSHNGLNSVAPLQIFHRSEFSVLDLSFNNLDSIETFCREIKNIKSKKLFLKGNPIVDNINYPGGLKHVIKNFKFIDDTPVESLSKDYTPVVQVKSSKENGFRVDYRNKADVYKFENSQDWHEVRIPDPNREFTKNEIFDYFFLTISDEFPALYPCHYVFVAGEHQFLLRDCFLNIVHLVEVCNLEIKIPRLNMTGVEEFQSGEIHINYEKVVKYYFLMNISPFKSGEIIPAECIDKALGRRYNPIDRLLDLDNFQNTPGLEKIIIHFSSQKVLQNVMSIAARKFLSSCIEILLSNNKILRVNISKSLSFMPKVKAIDLGNNWIYDLEQIRSLQSAKLKAIRLDGNPVCSQFTLAADYVKAVKEIFPEIHKLDNVEINKNSLSSQKNYLCDVKAYDFVEQFVPYYFKTFESTDRINLKCLYHEKAMFSMVCKYQPPKVTPQNKNRTEKYNRVSTNILNIHDLSLASDNMHYGRGEVMATLMSLPNMLFDLLNFTVDVPVFNDNMVIIYVTGVFSDQPTNILESEIFLGFSRTFVLVPTERNLGVLKCGINYQIAQDLLSVHQLSETQFKNSFRYTKNEKDLEEEEITTADKEDLLVMFQELTGLKSIWCTRCLSEGNWDFENSMDVFACLCDKNEIPDAAFI